MATERIYKVTHDGKTRLVKATSNHTAMNYVARSVIVVAPAKGLEIAELMQSGIALEDSSSEPATQQKEDSK